MAHSGDLDEQDEQDEQNAALRSELENQEVAADGEDAELEEADSAVTARAAQGKPAPRSQAPLFVMLGLLLLGALAVIWGLTQARSGGTGPGTSPSAIVILTP